MKKGTILSLDNFNRKLAYRTDKWNEKRNVRAQETKVEGAAVDRSTLSNISHLDRGKPYREMVRKEPVYE